MYAEVFPSRLKEARKKTGYTQVEVSEILKIKQATLSRYESGITQPDLETLASMAVLYNISIDWLCGVSIHGGPDLKQKFKENKEREKILKDLDKEALLEKKINAMWFYFQNKN